MTTARATFARRCSVTVPFKDAELLLGQWQQIARFEFDTRALTRDCHPDYRRVVRRERGPIAARI